MIELNLKAQTTIEMASLLQFFQPSLQALHGSVVPSRINVITPNHVADSEQKDAKSPTTTGTKVDESKPTLDDVRKVLVQINEKYGIDKARSILQKFGVNRVSDLKESTYVDFINSAKEMSK